MKFRLVFIVALVCACSEEEAPLSEVSEREKACWSDLNAFSLQHTEEDMAQFDTALEDESMIDEYMETNQLREAQFDLEYCRLYSQCFDGLTNQQRSDIVVACTKRRLRERVDDNF